MNKLVKELSARAFNLCQSYEDGHAVKSDEWAEKFAKLIIGECLNRIQGCHLAEGYDPTIVGDFELGYRKGIDKATSQVKLHFGIK